MTERPGAEESALQRQLEALFLEELQDGLQVLDDGLAEIERGTAGAEVVTQLFRVAHSLKGAAHAAGATDAVPTFHRLEETFAQLRDGDAAVDQLAMRLLGDDLVTLTRLARQRHGAGADAAERGPDDPAREPTVGPVAGVQPAEARARVAVGRLDRLIERAGVVVATTDRLRSLNEQIEDAAALASTEHGRAPAGSTQVLPTLVLRAREIERQLRVVATDLAETAQELRLQRFDDLTGSLVQSVREVCRSTGTDARVLVDGGEVELDRDIGDALREPLLHLVRNAVDHGIEAPAVRTARGKPATGTIRVAADGQGTEVCITIADDGAGLDLRRIRALVGRNELEADDDDIELAFRPGLSTAREITDVSGRGMGLDAARARIESLGGSLRLETVTGRGTEIELRVPRTLSVLRVLVVDVGDDELVALPLAGVARLHRLGPGQVEHVEGRTEVVVGDHRHPAASLSAALSLPSDGSEPTVAVAVPGEDGVLLVTRAVTEAEVVLRSLPHRVGAVGGMLGTAMLSEGRPALVVNPSSALRAGLAVPTAPPVASSTAARRRRVLLAEDTATTRALERSILERAGYAVLAASDGVAALDLLQEHSVDVVVTDVDMPRMDGIELCRAVRASAGHRRVPVILVTSLGSEQDRQRGLDAGADAYIVKSAFDQVALLDAVGRFT